LGSLHSPHTGHAAEAENHAVQVAHIFSFDDKLDDSFAILVVAHLHAANVGVVVGDGRR